MVSVRIHLISIKQRNLSMKPSGGEVLFKLALAAVFILFMLTVGPKLISSIVSSHVTDKIGSE